MKIEKTENVQQTFQPNQDLQRSSPQLPVHDQLIYGGGNNGDIWDILGEIGNFLLSILCFPCNLIIDLLDDNSKGGGGGPGPDPLGGAGGGGRPGPGPVGAAGGGGRPGPGPVGGGGGRPGPIGDRKYPPPSANEARQIAKIHEELDDFMDWSKRANGKDRNGNLTIGNVSKVYFDQLHLLLRIIIWRLQDLEKELGKATDRDEKNRLKDLIKGCLRDMAGGSRMCAPRRYNESLYQFRKIMNVPETLYNRMLTLVRETKEDIILNYRASQGDFHELNGARDKFGLELGLDRDPVNLLDPYKHTRIGYDIGPYKELFVTEFTRETCIASLEVRINLESDKSLYLEALGRILQPEIARLQNNLKWDESFALMDKYVVDGVYTKEAVELFMKEDPDPVDENPDPSKGPVLYKPKLTELFDVRGGINWNNMKAIPYPFDLTSYARQARVSGFDFDNLDLQEVVNIWDRVAPIVIA